MTPEEFYHLNKLKKLSSKETLFEMRVKSLDWMLGCFLKGTIRRKTIVNLIPLVELDDLLLYMEERERYEDCATIKDVIDIVYKQKYLTKENMSLKRKNEIIKLLTKTIETEKLKTGGGNKELIEKLEIKLEDVINKKPKK